MRSRWLFSTEEGLGSRIQGGFRFGFGAAGRSRVQVLGQELVDALSFVLLGVQVDHNDLPRRGESYVVASAMAEVMREVAVSRVVFPPCSD